MKKFVLITGLIIIGIFSLNAQRNAINYNQYSHIGGYIHYVLNQHLTDFTTLPGCYTCNPGFTSGYGSGIGVGGLFELPLNDKDLFLSIRLGYTLRNAELTTEEKIGNALDKGITAPRVTNIMVEHSLTSKLSSIDLEPQLIYTLFDNFRASLGIKGAYLLTKTFSQKESIIKPNNIVFDDTKTIERNVYEEQEIPGVKSFLTYLTFGVSYDIRLKSGFVIAPEIRYELPLYNLTDVSWKPAAFNFGVALRLPLASYEKPVYDSTFYIRDTTEVYSEAGNTTPRIYLKDTKETVNQIEYDDYKLNRRVITEYYVKEIPKDVRKPDASIMVRGIDQYGNYTPMPQLTIEEIETEETFPLLPQIFFADNSNEIDKTRLHFISADEINTFDEHKINWNTLSIYYELLNIVGKRMKENPKAILTITGCNNNLGNEANNLDLSKARADVIKNYLQNVWKIEAKRLKAVSRNLPEKQANNTIPDGIEENRRAELSSNDPNILKPVKLMDIQRTANPPVVRIYPKVKSKNVINNWNLDIIQSGNALRNYNGTNMPDSVDWVVETNPLPSEEMPVNIKITAKDNKNQIAVAETDIKIVQKTIKKKKIEMLGDKKVERFSLILFDYDKNDVTPNQAEAIKQMKSRIQPNSTITITGYADRTGDAAYNKQLSLERAINVQKSLGLTEDKTKVIGAGNSVKLFDNSLPEGRSYSRTVKIVVETPIK